MEPCQTLSVTEAARLLGIGRVRMYDAVREGRVASLRVGSKPKYRIPKRTIERLLDHPEEFKLGRKRSVRS